VSPVIIQGLLIQDIWDTMVQKCTVKGRACEVLNTSEDPGDIYGTK